MECKISHMTQRMALFVEIKKINKKNKKICDNTQEKNNNKKKKITGLARLVFSAA